MQKVTDFYSIEGVTPGVAVEMKEVRRLRKRTEHGVWDKFLGSSSGLSASTIEELSKWDQLFDFEVHGGRLSFGGTLDWLHGRGALRVLPKFDPKVFSMYMNRACEIGWMIHRLIPLVQPPGIPLASDWKAKWRIIDKSYQLTVESLSTDLGKPIGNAIKEFVLAKFPFTCDMEFPLL